MWRLLFKNYSLDDLENYVEYLCSTDCVLANTIDWEWVEVVFS